MIKAYGQHVFDLLAERPEQLVMFQAADVRFGSLADIIQRQRHVRFTPNSGHDPPDHQCPLSARSRHPPIAGDRRG